jgi:hypothetical protein
MRIARGDLQWCIVIQAPVTSPADFSKILPCHGFEVIRDWVQTLPLA